MLAEELKAEPVWVINSGVSHLESLPTSQIDSWVDDVLDGIEFITGEIDTQYGSLRADMGHPNPWQLNFIAIGNEVDLGSNPKSDHICVWPFFFVILYF